MSANAGPAETHVAITPSDSTALTSIRGIYVGVGGDVAIQDSKGTTITYKNAVAGTIIPMAASKVMATNTTATNLIGLQG